MVPVFRGHPRARHYGSEYHPWTNNDQSPALLSKAGASVSFFGASGTRRVMPIGVLGGEPALNAAWAFRNGTSEQEALENSHFERGRDDRYGGSDR